MTSEDICTNCWPAHKAAVWDRLRELKKEGYLCEWCHKNPAETVHWTDQLEWNYICYECKDKLTDDDWWTGGTNPLRWSVCKHYMKYEKCYFLVKKKQQEARKK